MEFLVRWEGLTLWGSWVPQTCFVYAVSTAAAVEFTKGMLGRSLKAGSTFIDFKVLGAEFA